MWQGIQSARFHHSVWNYGHASGISGYIDMQGARICRLLVFLDDAWSIYPDAPVQ
jgi:hypothetical protein